MSKLKVLVVEDELIVAMDIAEQLRDLGAEPVGHAKSGEQAIELAGQLRPDLVMMDVHLASSMDGISAAQVIRDQFDIPCLFLSAFSGADSLARAQLTAPAGYLSKPFDESELGLALAAVSK
ncbi:response regulator [Roseateles albus]|uniref:Response regulator n=1 Tax=Roseateles albus TaxID=2987525 RepID=A0ABT5KA12_9BURK|nr:response regulator [Roseateles albus]